MPLLPSTNRESTGSSKSSKRFPALGRLRKSYCFLVVILFCFFLARQLSVFRPTHSDRRVLRVVHASADHKLNNGSFQPHGDLIAHESQHAPSPPRLGRKEVPNLAARIHDAGKTSSISSNLTSVPWYSSYVHPDAAKRAPALKYPVWWAAPVRSGSGYGSEARDFILGALEGGILRPEDVWVSQSGDGYSDDLESKLQPHVWDFIVKQDWENIQKVLTEEELKRPAIVVCHSFPDDWRRKGELNYPTNIPGVPCPLAEMKNRYTYQIGRTMFETALLPKHLVSHANEFDEVWVPSEFSRQSFIDSGVNAEKLRILPQAINTTIFDPSKHEALSLASLNATELATGTKLNADNPFVFLSIFKWESRKGWELLLRAFLEEFKHDEQVELHILTHPFMEMVPSWKEKIRSGIVNKCGMEVEDFDLLPRIYVASAFIGDEEYPAIYKSADALVIPTRGEGWGRPQMEAMAMGLPVISTNWSGLTAFLNEKTGYPIPIEPELAKAKKDGPSFFQFFAGGSWADPSLKELRKIMRHVFTNREEAKAVTLGSYPSYVALAHILLGSRSGVWSRLTVWSVDDRGGDSMQEAALDRTNRRKRSHEKVRESEIGSDEDDIEEADTFYMDQLYTLMDEDWASNEPFTKEVWERGERVDRAEQHGSNPNWKHWGGYNFGDIDEPAVDDTEHEQYTEAHFEDYRFSELGYD
eukprot:gene5101-34901_t